ncbi:MAG: tetratricopeptide repeat protein [Thermoleophilia bacterium]|nr:tetratricopeptide repeat protein [Thermoleophilia bacterium]
MTKIINISIGAVLVALLAAAGILVYFYLQPTSQASQKLERDLKMWQDHLKSEPDDALARANLGVIYREMGDIESATRELALAVELEPEGYTYITELALTYRQMGDTESALEHLKRAIDLYPNGEKFRAQYLVAEIYFESGDLESAKEFLQQSLEDNNTKWNSHYLMGQLYEREGNLEKAREEYGVAAVFNEDDEELQEALRRVS